MKFSDKILTFAAVFISCLALTVSIVQTRILQKQSQAAVWPRIDILDSFGADYYDVNVVNHGVGPAIIKSIEYNYQDTTVYRIVDLVRHIAKQEKEKQNSEHFSIDIGYSEILPGRVIKASESIEIYHARDSLSTRLALDYFDRLDIKIDYCSIYDYCWRFQNNETVDLD